MTNLTKKNEIYDTIEVISDKSTVISSVKC